jgi:hypothetical protein
MRGRITISNEDRKNILNQHSSLYDGYSTGNVPSVNQPLRVDNGPKDLNGITISNKGNITNYKNHQINESEIDLDTLFGDTETKPAEPKVAPSTKPERFSPYKPRPDVEPNPKAEDDGYTYDFLSDDDDDFELDMLFGDTETKPAEPKVAPSTKPERFSPYKPRPDVEPSPKAEDDDYTYDFLPEEDDEFINEGSELCECGGRIYEGECLECGGLYESIDDDIKENFLKEKTKIKEMFERFKKYN